jgi:hypothetical protein
MPARVKGRNTSTVTNQLQAAFEAAQAARRKKTVKALAFGKN